MLEELKQIAMRIKDLREINKLSTLDVAKCLEISVEEYENFETGKTDIPVGRLHILAKRYGVSLTALLTGEEPRLDVYSVVRAGRGGSSERRKEYKYSDLAYNFKDKKSEVFLVTVEPSADTMPHSYYAHEGQEFDYILEGQLKIVIDAKEIILNAGDSIYFDSTHPHGLSAIGNKTVKFLAVII